MRSSSGEHFLGLDHVRALAAFMVFSWHFCHSQNGYPVPFAGAPSIFPLALLDEGHTGVALFMTLSGYLFAKLLDNKSIDYPRFIWNRILRLLPLLMFVVAVYGVKQMYDGLPMTGFAQHLIAGAIFPGLPNGGWSITVEFHFYLILPILLVAMQRYRFAIIAFLTLAILLRLALYLHYGEVQTLAYHTIIGRIDQFMLGIAAFQLSHLIKGRHWIAAATALGFAAFYWLFDLMGGFFLMPAYPSPSFLWLVLPTIEGAAYALLIAYYDRTYSPSATGVSWLIGKAGNYSYSIYLLHPFVVFGMAKFVQTHVTDLSNWYVAEAFAVLGFALMMPIGYLSFRFLEAPFLKFRVRYTRSLEAASALGAPKAVHQNRVSLANERSRDVHGADAFARKPTEKPLILENS